MAWVKHTIDLDPMTVEVRERVPLNGPNISGFTTRKVGEREVVVRITIDTGKIRTLGRRAAESKTGKATLHFGAITASVLKAGLVRRSDAA